MKIKNLLLILLLALVSFIVVGCKNNDEAVALTKKLYIVNHTEIKGSFPLPKYVEGNKEAPVAWTSNNTELISIGEYPAWDEKFDHDLYVKATVVLPEEETVVTLTATVTFGDQVAKRDMQVTVVPNEFTVVTAAGAKQVAKDAKIQVNGTVVMAGDAGYIVKDDTGYIYAYLAKHGLKVGDKVQVRGLRDTYNFMPQIKTPVAEKVGEEGAGFDPYLNLPEKTIAEVIATPYTNVDFFCSMFKLKGVVGTTDDANNPYSFSNPLNLAEKVVVTKYSNAGALTELNENKGKYVEAIVMVYSYRANEYNLLYVEDSLTEKSFTYTEQNYVDIALQMLQQKYGDMLVTGDMTLDSEIGMEGHLATVTWESLNTDIIKHDGKVTLPEADTKVTLKVDLVLGDKTATGTVEVNVKKLSVSTIASLIPLTPAKGTDEKPVVLVQGVVIGYQYKGYWIADATGAILIYVNANIVAGTNAPQIGQVAQVKGGLTTFGETNEFTVQIAPIGTFTLVEDPAPTLPTPTTLSFDTMFGLGVTTRDQAKTAALTYYGKVFKITGNLIQMSTDNFWKIQDPTNPNRWFRMNNLASNAALLPLKNNDNPKNVTITVIVRDIYFIDDTSAYNNFKAGAFGGVFFVNEDVVVN